MLRGGCGIWGAITVVWVSLNKEQHAMKQGTTLRLGSVLILLVVLTPWAPAQTQAPAPPVREITQIAGEIYRFRNNNHYAVFAVTPVGIIATDPINAEAAQWLKAELHKRFSQPVKYLIYSHD